MGDGQNTLHRLVFAFFLYAFTSTLFLVAVLDTKWSDVQVIVFILTFKITFISWFTAEFCLPCFEKEPKELDLTSGEVSGVEFATAGQ